MDTEDCDSIIQKVIDIVSNNDSTNEEKDKELQDICEIKHEKENAFLYQCLKYFCNEVLDEKQFEGRPSLARFFYDMLEKNRDKVKYHPMHDFLYATEKERLKNLTIPFEDRPLINDDKDLFILQRMFAEMDEQKD